jgi:hypothetical protein
LVARNLREAYAAGMPVDERTIDVALFLSKKVRIEAVMRTKPARFRAA